VDSECGRLIQSRTLEFCCENLTERCFLFRYPSVALTAAHCLTDIPADDVVVGFPSSRNRTLFNVSMANRHPTADLAVLSFQGLDERDITWTVNDPFDDAGLGLDFASFGYPVDAFAPNGSVTPRLFKGYVQRFSEYRSRLGFKYAAAELSIPCPIGLSGAAIFNSEYFSRLYGVVTENIEVATEISSEVQTDSDGSRVRETTRDVIKYGICLWLPAVKDWLNTQVAPVPQTEIQRRSINQDRWVAEELKGNS
jgi:hypothetical protein